MLDISDTIEAKSDHMVADDLMGGDKIITITNVTRISDDRPIAIHYEGSDKPFLPCKSMRRVLVSVWGKYADQWTGRSIMLYRDPNVKYAGQAVGGVRIKQMSHMDKAVKLSLTASSKSKAMVTITPLPEKHTPVVIDIAVLKDNAEGQAMKGMDAYQTYFKGITADERVALKDHHENLKTIAHDADVANNPEENHL